MSVALLAIAIQLSSIKLGPQSFCREVHLRSDSTVNLGVEPKTGTSDLVRVFENDSLLIEVEKSNAPEISKYSDSANGPLFSSLPINSYKAKQFLLTKMLVKALEDHHLLIFDKRNVVFLKQISRVKYTDHHCPAGTFYWEKYLLNGALIIDLSELKS